MKKHIVIIGGGISGLTAATLLARTGCHITLIEADAELGGLAKSKVLTGGYPTEHSLRVYHCVYACLFNILKTIPFNEQESIFQQLIPVSFAFCYQNDFYLYQTKKSKFKTFVDKYKLFQFLRKHGFQIKDFFHLIKEQFLALISWERLCKIIGKQNLREFFKKTSPHYLKIIYGCHQIGYAATYESAAFLAVEADMICDPFLLKMANGPTSERVIKPWENYLFSLGVDIKKQSKMIKINGDKNKISSMTLANGEKIVGDIFISAMPEKNMLNLINSSPDIVNLLPTLTDLNTNLEWSNGAQFFLSKLPKTQLFQPGILNLHIDSPWKLVTIIQGEAFWKNHKFPNDCHYALSATFSSIEEKGILYGKTILECTKEEILNEIIAQCHFEETDLIVKRCLDDSIVFMNNIEYEEKHNELNYHIAHQKNNGDWILNFSAYSVPTPINFLNSPATRTDISNLYLAGDYCKTTMLISTMEKACESGYAAAIAISEDYNLGKITLPFSSYNTKKYRIFRSLDEILFKIQKKAEKWVSFRNNISEGRG